MGNFSSKKKSKAEEEHVDEDVWIKVNNAQNKSPKTKKKKKKKKKKKGKGDSPDRTEEDASQCDSYSYSTLSSRKLSDSTIASTGTVTQHNVETENRSPGKQGFYYTDDQSNGSIGYVTASDTFTTPPSPRKGHKSKFSPVIARDSPRVVRRLLQSDKIIETKDESQENLSPRARFFLSTPEPSNRTTGFENRNFSRHSSGSSLDSKVAQGQVDEKSKQEFTMRGNDNRCITNGSLILKARQQENKISCNSRISNNSLDMSDSTQENLIRTGEKAKRLRYDCGNLSPAERRKFKSNELEKKYDNPSNKAGLPFVTFDQPPVNLKRDVIKPLSSNVKADNDKDHEQHMKNCLTVKPSMEHVPPPSPASGMTLSEVDESYINESETSEKILNKEDEVFGDSVCKRLSLLLEAEQDNSKLDRTEFYEFTDDSPSSSPEIPEAPDMICNDNFEKEINALEDLTIDKLCDISNSRQKGKYLTDDIDKLSSNESFHHLNNECFKDINIEKRSPVKTPMGQNNASVMDVMNNNFRMKPVEEIDQNERVLNVTCARVMHNTKKRNDRDIEKQMMHDNEINEKLIEERIKTLTNIIPTNNDSSKRSSCLFAINNKHSNDPDNYILVSKKTYCVKRGVLVELMDEEKDVIKREVIKTLDGIDWIAKGSEEKYKPELMSVEQGASVSCPSFPIYDEEFGTESDISDSYYNSSKPDYVNLEDFERHEREFEQEEEYIHRSDLEYEREEPEHLARNRDFEDTTSSEEEINYENILNRSQSESEMSDSRHDLSDSRRYSSDSRREISDSRHELSDSRHERGSDILSCVIQSYKKEDYSDYSDEISEEEILYAEEPQTKRGINVLRTPSKLDQSLHKIFQEKAKKIAAEALIQDHKKIEDFKENLVHEEKEITQATGYDSPYHKSSDSSRRSLAYTESDLDASEQWDDDDDASNDSMLADDEDDDDDFGQIIFSKPYIEHDQKTDAMFSFNMVKTLPESPIVWEPEPEDDDVFQDDIPNASGGYPPEDSFDLESSDEAFDDARKQMQEIHQQLQSLREQMVTFDNEEDNSSLPNSPFDDRMIDIPKVEIDKS